MELMYTCLPWSDSCFFHVTMDECVVDCRRSYLAVEKLLVGEVSDFSGAGGRAIGLKPRQRSALSEYFLLSCTPVSESINSYSLFKFVMGTTSDYALEHTAMTVRNWKPDNCMITFQLCYHHCNLVDNSLFK